MRTIKVDENVLSICSVKTECAKDLTIADLRVIVRWCDCQSESLWIGMSIQEILNVYRATAQYDTFERWAEEDWKEAYFAWNRAVVDEGNKMRIGY